MFELTHSQLPELREKAVGLLKRLPTDPKTVEEMLSRCQLDTKDEFLAWYRLTLVQYLLNNQADKREDFNEKVHSLSSERIAEWKKRFIDAKLYLKILKQAELFSEVCIRDLTDTARSCLSLCLQILRSLNDIPPLNKPLPESYTLRLIDVPHNELISRILPQLFSKMIAELLEPLLCLLLQRK